MSKNKTFTDEMKNKLPPLPEEDYLFPEEKPSTLPSQNNEPINEVVSNLQTYIPTNIALEEQTNKDINERLKLYLNIYSFKGLNKETNKDRFVATNVEINEELRKAMDKLISIYLDGVVANDTDKSYKEIVNNALTEYLLKQYKRLTQHE